MNIDELNIKFSSNTKSAKKGIENVTNALDALSKIDMSNIQLVITGLENLSTAMKGSKSPLGGADGIKKVSLETNKIKYSVENATPKITELREELKSLSNQDLSFGDKEFDKTFTQLQQNRDELKKYKKNLVDVANATKSPKKIWSEEEIKNLDEVVARAVSAKKAVETAGHSVSKAYSNSTEKITKAPLTDNMKEINEENKRVQQIMSEVRGKWFNLSSEQQKATLDATGMKNTTEFFNRVYEAACKGEKAFEKFSDTGVSSVKKIKGSITQTTPKIEELKEKLRELSNQGLTFGDKKFDSTYQDLQRNTFALKQYKTNLESANKPAKQMISPLNKVNSILKSLTKSGNAFGKSILKSAKKALTDGIKPLSKTIKHFANMLKSMLMRSVLYTAMKAVREGFGLLAKEDTKFNKSMSRMYSALMTLKNAFVAAFAPIVETVEPYVTSLINMLTTVVTKVTQVLAALTGSSSATIAKKLTLDYAEAMDESSSSTDKATDSNKKFKKSLMGFDEINKLNGDNSSNGSSSLDSFTTQFTTGDANDLAKRIKNAWENADFTDIGEIISSKIVGMLQGISWDKIQSYGFKGGKSFATLINGLFKYTNKDGDTLASSIGQTIAGGLNTLVDFVYAYVTNLKWDNVGSELSKSVSSLLTGINWDRIIKSSAKSGEGLANLIKHLFTDKDEFGNTSLSNVTKSIANIVNAIIAFVKNAVDELAEKDLDGKSGWYKLGESVSAALIKGIISINWDDLLKSIGGVAKGIYDLFDGIFGAFFEINEETGRSYGADLWENIGKQIVAGILAGMVATLALPFLSVAGGDSIFSEIFTTVYNGLCEAFGIESPAKEMYPVGGYIVQGVIEGIREKIQNIGADISEKFNKFKDKIDRWFTEKKEGFKAKGSGLVTNITTGIGDIWSRGKDKFNTFGTNISNWFSGKKNHFQNLGGNLVENIRNGIGDIWYEVRSNFIDFWNDLKDYLGSKTLKLGVEWDTTSTLGQALTKVGLQGMPKLSFFEGGGFPKIGDLFIANEKAPEMVGSLNNRPAVANNQQIETALENAMYRGMMAAGNNGGRNINLNVTIPLDESVLGKAMIDYHNGYVRTTGGSPLLIGG